MAVAVCRPTDPISIPFSAFLIVDQSFAEWRHNHGFPLCADTDGRFTVDAIRDILSGECLKGSYHLKWDVKDVVDWLTLDDLHEILRTIGFKPQHIQAFLKDFVSRIDYLTTTFPSTSRLPTMTTSPSSYPSTSFRLVCTVRNTLTLPLLETFAVTKYHRDPSSLDRFWCAVDIRTRRRACLLLLSGTSGSGKSTLTSVIASRLGLRNTLSTDAIRNVIRATTDPTQNPELFVSSYEVGELLAKTSRQDRLTEATTSSPSPLLLSRSTTISTSTSTSSLLLSPPSLPTTLASPKAPPPQLPHHLVETGYALQCALLKSAILQIIDSVVQSKNAMAIEGVHLSPSLIEDVMNRYSVPSSSNISTALAAPTSLSSRFHPPSLRPIIIPFLLVVSNRDKHHDRLAFRASISALGPSANRHVRNFSRIRTLQHFLVRGAHSISIPPVDNTSVDRSVAAVHSVVMRCWERTIQGKGLWIPTNDDHGQRNIDETRDEGTSSADEVTDGCGSMSGSETEQAKDKPVGSRGAVPVLRAMEEAMGFAWSSKRMQGIIRSKKMERARETDKGISKAEGILPINNTIHRTQRQKGVHGRGDEVEMREVGAVTFSDDDGVACNMRKWLSGGYSDGDIEGGTDREYVDDRGTGSKAPRALANKPRVRQKSIWKGLLVDGDHGDDECADPG